MTPERSERNEENVTLMLTIIRANLAAWNKSGAKIAYDACDEDLQTLIRAKLTVGEKKTLGLVAMSEIDHVQFALKTLMRRRESEAYGKPYKVDAKKLNHNARAMATYQMLTA
jgi:hypothetical protein